VPPKYIVHGRERPKPKQRTGLYSAQIRLLGSENAFRIGPQIKTLEDQGHKVIKCNLGEPDFPLAAHIADEVKSQIDRGSRTIATRRASFLCGRPLHAPWRNAEIS